MSETAAIVDGLNRFMRERRVDVPTLAELVRAHYPGFHRATLYRWLNGETGKIHAKYFDALSAVAGTYMPPGVRRVASAATVGTGATLAEAGRAYAAAPREASRAGSVLLSAEMRAVLAERMLELGMTYESLSRAVGYDKPETLKRLIAGELPVYLTMLAQVLHVLEVPPARLELPEDLTAELGRIPRAHFQVRDVPLIDGEHVDQLALSNGSLEVRSWHGLAKSPAPTDGRKYLAFTVEDAGMEPRLAPGDVVLVDKEAPLEPGHVCVALLVEGGYRVRLYDVARGLVVLKPLNPAMPMDMLDRSELRWIGRAVRKTGAL